MDPETPLHFRPILAHLLFLFKEVNYSIEEFYKRYYSKEEERLFENCEDSLKKIARFKASAHKEEEAFLKKCSGSRKEIIYLGISISRENKVLIDTCEHSFKQINLHKVSICSDYSNLNTLLGGIYREFISTLHEMIASKKEEHKHSQNESLLRFMFRISSSAVLITFTTVIAILAFLPTTPLMIVLLTLVAGSTLVLFYINKLFLIDESPHLTSTKETLAASKETLASLSVQLEDLILEHRKKLDTLILTLHTPEGLRQVLNKSTTSNDSDYETGESTVEFSEHDASKNDNSPPPHQGLSQRRGLSITPFESRLIEAASNRSATGRPVVRSSSWLAINRAPFFHTPLSTEARNDNTTNNYPLQTSTPSISP